MTDSRDVYLNTPLHLAAAARDAIKTRQLIDQKADVNAVNDDLRTPLHMAVSNDSLDVTKILLDSKAAVNMQGKTGRTALHEATFMPACKEIFELLLQVGADKSLLNESGQTAKSLAETEMDHGAPSHSYLCASLRLKYQAIIDLLT